MARAKTFFRLTAGLAVPLAALIYATPVLAAGPAVPPLGLAGNFGALGGTGVTCTMPNNLPATTITGNVGSGSVAPTTVTGFPGFTPGANPCSLSGSVQLSRTAAMGNMLTAYNALAATPCPAANNLSGDLGGMHLPAGVYCISGVALLTSPLTLTGTATDTWIFKATSITPIGGSVVMAGGSACNVYWQLGTTAVFNNSNFAGNVLAGTSISFTGASSSLTGRALAQAAVTMTGAHIAACTASGGGGGGGGGGEGNNNDNDNDNDNDNGGHDGDHHGDDGDHHGDGGDKHHGEDGGEHHGNGGSHGE